jgi:protein SPIRAL1 and related proteins
MTAAPVSSVAPPSRTSAVAPVSRTSGVAPKPAPVAREEPATRPVARDMSNRVSANVFASGANQNCGNFITDRPTSRVLSAPGGRSSIVLG